MQPDLCRSRPLRAGNLAEATLPRLPEDRGPQPLMGRIRARHPAPYTAPERPAAPDQFRVIPGRAALHTQASTTNNPLLSELAPTNTLWIHTERAQGPWHCRWRLG